MVKIKIISQGGISLIESESGPSLLDILRSNGVKTYAPCGGKGKCGKCRVNLKGIGETIACRYHPFDDIEVLLPGEDEANILVHQTEYLEDLDYDRGDSEFPGENSTGVAIDIGTTTVVLYFLDLKTGQIQKISSFINPQKAYGADVITRINYCQEHANGLAELQSSIVGAINYELDDYLEKRNLNSSSLEKVVIVGNTTMLHLLLGEDPLSIALAPFTPRFTAGQLKKGYETGFNIHADAEVITLPCISAYVGADIVAGLAALNVPQKNYLFLDIGTNGEMALVRGSEIFTCATAAGPAFEGANIYCGMGAVTGAISVFTGPGNYHVIGNAEPKGICGSGIVDVVAYLIQSGLVDETGLLKEDFIIDGERGIKVIQKDIREIQLAKSAIFSGIKILVERAQLDVNDIDALFLAGGFGNYISIRSAVQIGLLPYELRERIYPVGNSAGIGALQYLKSSYFENKTGRIMDSASYIELSNVEDFPMEFALNMDFLRHDL
jgi:uncharacterized 2Fe-2S/4Fe-4S cluster protein (DUF4445 family)